MSGIYYFKPQSISISASFLAIISYLMGNGMALVIPRKGRIGHLLNPGPFNIKEHLAIVIMASSATVTALGLEIITTERLYYDKRTSGALAFFMLLSSQFLGYGMAGLMRRILVYPSVMLWPSNIPINSMLESLHLDLPENRKPLRVFMYVFCAVFVWEIFPQWICPLLAGVSIFCLANRTSPVFTNIFGGSSGNEGLGLFSLCFDWNYITSPLYYPVSSLISQGIGICGCIALFTGVYYSNIWDAQNYPFLSQLIFSNTSTIENAEQWNQSAAVGPDGRIDMAAVETLGLPSFAASNVLNVLLTNMCIAAAIAHLFMWNPTELKTAFQFLKPSEIWAGVRRLPGRVRHPSRTRIEEMKPHYDPHFRLTQTYKECPDWWYGILFVGSVVAGLVVIYQSDSTLPWWGFLIACLVGYLLLVVLGSMEAMSGVAFTIQSIVQMIGGYIQPGHPVANMYFSLYGYNALRQGISFASGLKFGQYGHLAPRVTFAMQLLGTLVGTVLNYAMANTIIDNQADILKSVYGSNIWSGQAAQQFNAQAVTFGGLPHEMFSIGGKYPWVPLATLLGFVAPLPFWLAHRRWPHLGLSYVNTPVILFYMCYLNLGINSGIMMFFLLGFVSQGYIRRKFPNTFVRYNYLVSAGLDGGTAVMIFILSFAVLGAAKAPVAFRESSLPFSPSFSFSLSLYGFHAFVFLFRAFC